MGNILLKMSIIEYTRINEKTERMDNMARYYYHEWTNEEEATLTQLVESGRKQRKKIDEIFGEAAEKLERTKASVRNHWYKVVNDQNQRKAV